MDVAHHRIMLTQYGGQMPIELLSKKPEVRLVPSAFYCDLHGAKNLNFQNLNDAIPEGIFGLCKAKHSDNDQSFRIPPFCRVPVNEPSGALLCNIRSLISRGRFPTGNCKLPLTSLCGKTNFVSFRFLPQEPDTLLAASVSRGAVRVNMLCYEAKNSQKSHIQIPLYEADMITRTCTELGPSLYLMTTKGIFQFRCTERGYYNYQFWESQMSFLGVKLIMPHDMFVPTSSQPIGEGSFAKVFTAIHRSSGNPIVIKRMPKKKPSSLPQNRESAVQLEIGILRKLSHPYIVRFELAYEDDTFHYIVLEKLRGGTVNAWLRQHKRMTETQACQVIKRILAVLVELQANNIVHRDLKPENLVLQNSDDPTSLKIIDFGLAAYLGSSRMNMFCGSPGFVAPEIIEKQQYGNRVDMFSVGVLLYAFLSGKTPFHIGKDTPSVTLLRNKICKIFFDAPIWHKISNEAKDFLLALLQKDPQKRMSLQEALNSPWITQSSFTASSGEQSVVDMNPDEMHAIRSVKPNSSLNVNHQQNEMCQIASSISRQSRCSPTIPPDLPFDPLSHYHAQFCKTQTSPIYSNGIFLQKYGTNAIEGRAQFHHAVNANFNNTRLSFLEANKLVATLSHQLKCN